MDKIKDILVKISDTNKSYLLKVKESDLLDPCTKCNYHYKNGVKFSCRNIILSAGISLGDICSCESDLITNKCISDIKEVDYSIRSLFCEDNCPFNKIDPIESCLSKDECPIKDLIKLINLDVLEI